MPEGRFNLQAHVIAQKRRRTGWGNRSFVESGRLAGDQGLRTIRESCRRPGTLKVAPGGWGAEYPEPVLGAGPQATIRRITLYCGGLRPGPGPHFV